MRNRPNRIAGFTLIELMIVVAIIAIIAAIAIPNLLSARLNANETSAVSTLRNISSAQAQFQASAKNDVDNDGTGEFGYFRELSGAIGARTSADGSTRGSLVQPPVLSGAFRTIDANGAVSRSGYLFTLILPMAGGDGGLDFGTIGFSGPLDSDLAETTWCAYSHPTNYGNSGNRTFFVNQTGDITQTDESDYSGPTGYVNLTPGVAFSGAGGNPDTITGQVAVGTVGRDGNVWRQVN